MRIEIPTTNLRDARAAAERAAVRAAATSSRSMGEVAQRLGVSERRARELCQLHGPGLVEFVDLEGELVRSGFTEQREVA